VVAQLDGRLARVGLEVDLFGFVWFFVLVFVVVVVV
jgi:hypothetical protein